MVNINPIREDWKNVARVKYRRPELDQKTFRLGPARRPRRTYRRSHMAHGFITRISFAAIIHQHFQRTYPGCSGDVQHCTNWQLDSRVASLNSHQPAIVSTALM